MSKLLTRNGTRIVSSVLLAVYKLETPFMNLLDSFFARIAAPSVVFVPNLFQGNMCWHSIISITKSVSGAQSAPGV
jgi:hypothetical protein